MVSTLPTCKRAKRTSNNTCREEFGTPKVFTLLSSALEKLFQVSVEEKIQPPSEAVTQ
jgi:hypothetical protein